MHEGPTENHLGELGSLYKYYYYYHYYYYYYYYNTDINELGLVRFSSMTWNFLDNTCTKIQNMAFKTSQMDQIALEY